MCTKVCDEEVDDSPRVGNLFASEEPKETLNLKPETLNLKI